VGTNYIATRGSLTKGLDHACTQLRATPTVIFLGISIRRDEIPIQIRSSSGNSNSQPRKKFLKN